MIKKFKPNKAQEKLLELIKKELKKDKPLFNFRMHRHRIDLFFSDFNLKEFLEHFRIKPPNSRST